MKIWSIERAAPVARFQVVLHKDTPIFVPGSSAIEKQLDIQAHESQGHYTRPAIFRSAVEVSVDRDGSFSVEWEDGSKSYVTATAVASYAIS